MTQENTDFSYYVHVGLAKTGSTFLQRHVFPKFRGIHYIKKSNYFKKTDIITRSTFNTFLFSHESIIKNKRIIRDNGRIKDLSKEYPNAKIIIFFRRHDRWIKSKYYYYIRKNGFEPFNRYFDLEHDTGKVKKEMLDYGRDIRLIESHFPTKPLVIFQEELARHPSKVIALLADYMGAHYSEKDINLNTINTAFSLKQLRTIRSFNSVFKYKPSRHPVKLIRRTHKNLRKLAVHGVGLFSLCIPDSFQNIDEPLIPHEKLNEIREYFADDWQFCLDYVGNERKLLF